MRVLLTGATGFLGKAIAAALYEAGCSLVVAQRGSAVTLLPPDVVSVPFDLRQADGLASLPTDLDAVVHAAALVPERFNDLTAADLLWQTNGLATLRLATWAKAVGVKRFIYCSSYAIYQRPLPYPVPETHPVYPAGPATPYALSKLAGEAFALMQADADFSVCSLRFSAIYGGGMAWSGVLPAFVTKARQNQPIVIQAHPDSIFDFVHVSDAAQAAVLSLESPSYHQIYNVGGGVGVTLPQLAQVVWDIFAPAYPPQIQCVDFSSKRVLTSLDIVRGQQDLNYQPRKSITDGLLEMREWEK